MLKFHGVIGVSGHVQLKNIVRKDPLKAEGLDFLNDNAVDVVYEAMQTEDDFLIQGRDQKRLDLVVRAMNLLFLDELMLNIDEYRLKGRGVLESWALAADVEAFVVRASKLDEKEMGKMRKMIREEGNAVEETVEEVATATKTKTQKGEGTMNKQAEKKSAMGSKSVDEKAQAFLNKNKEKIASAKKDNKKEDENMNEKKSGVSVVGVKDHERGTGGTGVSVAGHKREEQSSSRFKGGKMGGRTTRTLNENAKEKTVGVGLDKNKINFDEAKPRQGRFEGPWYLNQSLYPSLERLEDIIAERGDKELLITDLQFINPASLYDYDFGDVVAVVRVSRGRRQYDFRIKKDDREGKEGQVRTTNIYWNNLPKYGLTPQFAYWKKNENQDATVFCNCRSKHFVPLNTEKECGCGAMIEVKVEGDTAYGTIVETDIDKLKRAKTTEEVKAAHTVTELDGKQMSIGEVVQVPKDDLGKEEIAIAIAFAHYRMGGDMHGVIEG